MSELGSLENPAPKHRKSGSRLDRFSTNPAVNFIFDVLMILLTALVLSLLVKTFLVRSFFIPSASMETTLMIDDRIIVNELVPNVVPLNRGDVIVFRDPGGWLGVQTKTEQNFIVQSWDWFLSAFGITAPDSEQHLVKRLIGMPGDHVESDAAGHVKVNGKLLSEPYIQKGDWPCGGRDNSADQSFSVTVPEGSYWMMGDNRGNSADSRCHQDLPSKGFVKKSFIAGRAFVVSFPIGHWSWLDNYPNVFKDIPKP